MAKPPALNLGKLPPTGAAGTINSQQQQQNATAAVATRDSDPSAAAANPAAQRELQRLDEAATKRCLVYCRLRPEKPQDLEDGATRLLSLTKRVVKVKDDKEYEYDGTFGGDSTQSEVFEGVAKPCVQHALQGCRAAIMAYGQTGTGKTFTLCNLAPGLEGIVPRAAQMIFDHIAADTARKYEVEGQFIQIYRDNLGDLMTESGRDRVDIYFDKDQGVTLPGCSSHPLTSKEEFLRLFREGSARRVTTATAMNPESSRSHSALVIWITSKPVGDDPTASERIGKITFIDLAGYERFSKTGISNSNAIMKDEAKTINASLLSLGHVVTSLSNGDKHIPWRNAKLTRLLQDSVGGRSRTTIVLTVGPSSNHLFESTNSLQFGQRAMAVKVQSKVTEVTDYVKLAAHLQSLLNEKQSHIDSLEGKLAVFAAQQDELRGRHDRDVAQLSTQHAEELRALRDAGAPDDKLQSVLRQHDVEMEVMRQQQKEELSYEAEAYEKQTIALVEEELHTADVRAATSTVEHLERVKQLELQLQMAEDEIDSLRGQLGMPPLAAAPPQQSAEGADHSIVDGEAPTDASELSGSRLATASNGGGGSGVAPPWYVDSTAHLSRAELVDAMAALQQQLDVKHTVLVEVQLQLDLMTAAHRERGIEITELREQLQRQPANAVTRSFEGASAADDFSMPLPSARRRAAAARQVELVDAQELAALRAVKDSEIAEHLATIDALRQELQQQQQQQQGSSPGGGGVDGSFNAQPPLSARIHTARGRRGTTIGAHQDTLTAMNAHLKQRVQDLETELASAAQALADAADGTARRVCDDPDDALVIDDLERRLEAAEAALEASRGELSLHRLADAERSSRHATLLSEAGAAFEKAEALAAQWEAAQKELACARQDTADALSREGALRSALDAAETRAADLQRARDEVAAELQEALAAAKRESSAGAIAAAVAAEQAARVREVDALSAKVAAAEAQAAEARKELALAKKAIDERTSDTVALRGQVDGLKSDLEAAQLDIAVRTQAETLERGRLREALRLAEDKANEAVAAATVSSSRALALEVELAHGKAAALEQKQTFERSMILEVESAVSDAIASIAAERDALREELNTALTQRQGTAALAAAPSPPETTGGTAPGDVAFKIAELQSKVALATKQAQQHRDEWAAAAARAKEAEQKLAAAHDQHQTALRALAADRDRLAMQVSERQAEVAALTELVQQERVKVANAAADLEKERDAAAGAVARSAAQRNHAAVERTLSIINDQHQALLSELQHALFATRSGSGDAASVLLERKVLVDMLRSSRAKYTQLCSHVAQLCGHVAECHSVLRAQTSSVLREDLTLRLTTRPGADALFMKDVQAVVAQRDDELHSKDQLIVDLTVELDAARAAVEVGATVGDAGALPSPAAKLAAGGGAEQQPNVVLRGVSAAAAHGVVGFLEGEQYRDHMSTVERSLRRRADDNNRLTLKVQILREQLEKLGVVPNTDATVAAASPALTGNGATAISREQLAAETSIDTSDLQILIDCKEAELRVVSYRLEQRERALATMTDHVQKLRSELRAALHAAGGGGGTAPADLDGSTISSGSMTPRLSSSSAAATALITSTAGGALGPQQHDAMVAAIRAIDAMQPETLSREQLEGMLSVMKALRKQNGTLHVLLCERGSLLRHFAWLLVHHGILPVNAETVSATAGDQASELRSAFVERDEELYMKDRVLLERSSQVILLEQACRELYAQLESHNITPARSVIDVTQSVVDAQRSAQQRILGRDNSRARLHEKHVALMQEVNEIDGMMMAYATRQAELESELAAAPKDTELQAHVADIGQEVVHLRVKKDQVVNALAVVDAQCSSHEDEVRLLRQVLAHTTRTVVDLQAQLQRGGGAAFSTSGPQSTAHAPFVVKDHHGAMAPMSAAAPSTDAPKEKESGPGCFFRKLKEKLK